MLAQLLKMEKINPLLQTAVLLNLSKFLSFDDLKNGRLVCRQWYYDLTWKFARRSKFELRINDSRRKNINNFVTILESSEIFFISSVCLYLDNIDNIIQHLLTLCHKRITELEIKEQYDRMNITSSQFQNIIQNATHLTKLVICLPKLTEKLDTAFDRAPVSLSNLRSIEFIGYADCNTIFCHCENEQFQFFTKIFSSATGLTEIIINTDRHVTPKSALNALKHTDNFKHISKLELAGSINRESLKILSQLSDKGMTLTTLKLFMWTDTDGTCSDDIICWKYLDDILEKQIRSLKELHLTGVDEIIEMRNLSRVESLRIVLQPEVATCRFVGGIDPIRYAKECRGITIKTNPEVSVRVPYLGWSFNQLKTLKRIFPKIESLSMVVLGDNMSDIWNMSGLRHLHLICDFPGITQSFLSFSEITMKKIISKKLYAVPAKWDSLQRTGPSVTNLRDLKYLRVRIGNDPNLKALVYMGFAKMTWLDTLILEFTVLIYDSLLDFRYSKKGENKVSNLGSSATTLRISSLALLYSVAEYCCPVWSCCSHVGRIDTVLNSCLRIISGTIQSTPVPWLSVLSNIQPPFIRRKIAMAREARKIFSNPDLSIHQDIDNRVGVRLSSRNPFWMNIQDMDCENYSPENDYINFWNDSQVVNSNLITDPNKKLPGFDLPRKTWIQLNRIRSNHGRCNSTLHKWNSSISSECDCGYMNQTIHHIVNDCRNRKFSGGLTAVNELSDSAIQWLNDLDIML